MIFASHIPRVPLSSFWQIFHVLLLPFGLDEAMRKRRKEEEKKKRKKREKKGKRKEKERKRGKEERKPFCDNNSLKRQCFKCDIRALKKDTFWYPEHFLI